MRHRVLVVDLDGTICEDLPTFQRSLAQPLDGARERLQEFRAAGWHIIVYTARGWSEYEMTVEWLDTWAIPYDSVMCGKPIADLWLDDRTTRFMGWDVVRMEL